jgi:hypothetical protein
VHELMLSAVLKHDTAYRHAPETFPRYRAGESCLVYLNRTATGLTIRLRDKIVYLLTPRSRVLLEKLTGL